MRVLVTGHLGYIGTVLVPMLQGAGHEVTGCDTDLYSGCSFEPHPPTTDGAAGAGDVRDLEAADLADLDAVVHLAALSNDSLGDLDPSLTHEINHAASVRLARLAKQAGVRRFVFSSSCSSYGAAGDDLVDEQAPLRPLTAYAVSKVRAEEDLSRLADRDFSPVFLRNATAYGVSPRLRCDLVVNDLVGWGCATGRIRLRSDGRAWRPVVHVADIARACVAVLAAPHEAVHEQAFNVGRTDHNFRIRELAAVVEDALPGTHVETAPGAGTDHRSYRVSFEKLALRVPAAVPQRDVVDGARELARAYRRAGLTLAELEGPRFRRIDRVRWRLAQGTLDETLRPRLAAHAGLALDAR